MPGSGARFRPLVGTVDAAHGDRLDQQVRALVTAATHHEPSKATIRRLVVGGAVRVNGQLARQLAESVWPGDHLQVFVDPTTLPRPHSRLELTEADVLFEDDWLLVVDKPAGVPTHATIDPRRPDLHRAARALLAGRQSPGDPGDRPAGEPPYLGIHHRLDRDTSGVVLFTKDTSINGAVGRLFAERAIDKTYLALVAAASQPPTDRWTVRNYLGRVGKVGRATRYGSVRAGGDLAITGFRNLGRTPAGAWLIEAAPHTGRTHQVRVHLAEGGTPILGDDLYGGPPASRTLLHASRLAFPHPVSGQRVVIESPTPADMSSPSTGHSHTDRPGSAGADQPASVRTSGRRGSDRRTGRNRYPGGGK